MSLHISSQTKGSTLIAWRAWTLRVLVWVVTSSLWLRRSDMPPNTLNGENYISISGVTSRLLILFVISEFVKKPFCVLIIGLDLISQKSISDISCLQFQTQLLKKDFRCYLCSVSSTLLYHLPVTSDLELMHLYYRSWKSRVTQPSQALMFEIHKMTMTKNPNFEEHKLID